MPTEASYDDFIQHHAGIEWLYIDIPFMPRHLINQLPRLRGLYAPSWSGVVFPFRAPVPDTLEYLKFEPDPLMPHCVPLFLDFSCLHTAIIKVIGAECGRWVLDSLPPTIKRLKMILPRSPPVWPTVT